MKQIGELTNRGKPMEVTDEPKEKRRRNNDVAMAAVRGGTRGGGKIILVKRPKRLGTKVKKRKLETTKVKTEKNDVIASPSTTCRAGSTTENLLTGCSATCRARTP